ncbi:MAG: SRPBCC domain-containing protein [Flavobacterium sp.]|nr:MAG: SRPBCC domain-containing protein [Flavobacterium sp.]
MNSNSPFDFTVDKSSKTVRIDMKFDAGLALVWDAFTKKEILDQWYAPKPYTSETKYMDFEVGGKRFYAMVSPEGNKRWGIQTYNIINPKTFIQMSNTFADENENPELPGSEWDLNFTEESGQTEVRIVVTNESLDRMEKLLEGFTIGFRMIFENLTELLAAQTQQNSSK